MSMFSILSSHSNNDLSCAQYWQPQVIKRPNVYNYKIINWITFMEFVILDVIYPDCISYNYEGHKILVFENDSIDTIKSLKFLEPHFLDNPNYITPIARFVPNQKGANYAIKLVMALRGFKAIPEEFQKNVNDFILSFPKPRK